MAEDELEGFDYQKVFEETDQENKKLQAKNSELTTAIAGSSFGGGQEDETLIHYQLETEKILGRIEHFLRGDVVKIDPEGNVKYETPKKTIMCKIIKKEGITYAIDINEKRIWAVTETDFKFNKEELSTYKDFGDGTPILQDKEATLIKWKKIVIIDRSQQNLNDYGVAEIMRIMSMYVTKETFLSNYTEERINEILADLGDALADFLYCNYEKMGMDTKFKESKFSIIVQNLLHVTESCYRRALNGEEMKGLRQRAIVTQTNMGSQNMGGGIQRPKRHPFKPSTW